MCGMTKLSEATQEILRKLARSIALHRRAGGMLDGLPAAEQELLQAMNEAQRDFFMAELAEAGAEEARRRFRAQLLQWRAQQPDSGADPEGVP
jgi:hypothetical protein